MARTINKAGDENYFHQQLLKYGPIVKITTLGESREIKRFVLESRFVPLQTGWWGREATNGGWTSYINKSICFQRWIVNGACTSHFVYRADTELFLRGGARGRVAKIYY